MTPILLQQVIQADAIGIFLLALILSPFIIPAIIKKNKISEAEDIVRRYPDGVRRIIGWVPKSISYDTAKSIVNKHWEISSAQREYNEAEKKRALEKSIREKAAVLRRECPDVCTGKTDEYLANNEYSVRSEQRKYNERKEEAKRILSSYPDGATAVCGHISTWSISESNIKKLIENKLKIQAEQRKIEANKAELAKISPQLSEVKKKYPLAVKEIVKEHKWSLSRAEDAKALLLLIDSFSARQEVEEDKIISNKVRLDIIVQKITKERDDAKDMWFWSLARSRIVASYGEKVAAKVEEELAAEHRYNSIISLLDTIEKSQNDFAKETRSLIPEYFEGWGWYSNEFSLSYCDNNGRTKTNKLKIWQPFCESCCFDEEVSYEYYPKYKNNRIFREQLRGTYSYNEPVWTKVLSFISKLKEKYAEEVFVVLANTDNLSDRSLENNFRIIKNKLSDAGISYGFKVPQNTSRASNKTYVIIDIITENSKFIKFCEELYSFRYGDNIEPNQGLTRIVYISMLRCFDGSEVEELNQKAIKAKAEELRKAKEEEDRKKREEAQRQQDKLDISNAQRIARSYPIGFHHYFPNQSTISLSAVQAKSIIQKEYSIRNHEETTLRLRRHVASWNNVAGVPYYFFYYYYPKRFTDISSVSQDAKRIVYNFKDGIAHSRVKQLVVSKIRDTFNSNDITKLTFVCIPASTKVVNENRYKDFSAEVCSDLGLKNAYNYITITKEKTPSHLGGNDCAEYSYDRNFFNGAFVILFDDIVTQGGSMSSMKSHLESIGATVICAISIGRTYSDYYGDIRKPHPYTGTL